MRKKFAELLEFSFQGLGCAFFAGSLVGGPRFHMQHGQKILKTKKKKIDIFVQYFALFFLILCHVQTFKSITELEHGSRDGVGKVN